jgi:hypothetical protein
MSIEASSLTAGSAAAATSSKRTGSELEQLDEEPSSKKQRTDEPTRSAAMTAAPVVSPLVRFFYGDLKRHLLHFMTQLEVVLLGHTARSVSAEALKFTEWPPELRMLLADGIEQLRARLQYPIVRKMTLLLELSADSDGIDMDEEEEVYSDNLETDLAARALPPFEPLTEDFEHLTGLTLRNESANSYELQLNMRNLERFTPIILPWRHTLQHIELHDFDVYWPWREFLFPELRTLVIRTETDMNVVWTLERLLDMNEAGLPKLEYLEVRFEFVYLCGFPLCTPLEILEVIESVRKKVRTPDREAAGIHFRFSCREFIWKRHYTLAEQEIWLESDEEDDPWPWSDEEEEEGEEEEEEEDEQEEGDDAQRQAEDGEEEQQDAETEVDERHDQDAADHDGAKQDDEAKSGLDSRPEPSTESPPSQDEPTAKI